MSSEQATTPNTHIPWYERVTVILTTSPVSSNPSTEFLEEVFKSFLLVPGLVHARKLIVCDGVKVTEQGKPLWKSGRITQDHVERYEAYKQRIRDLIRLANPTNEKECEVLEKVLNSRHSPVPITVTLNGVSIQAADPAAIRALTNAELVELPTRHGFGFGVRAALQHVTTEYVLVIQHDRKFARPVDLKRLVRDMDLHHARYLSFVQRSLTKDSLVYKALTSTQETGAVGRLRKHWSTYNGPKAPEVGAVVEFPASDTYLESAEYPTSPIQVAKESFRTIALSRMKMQPVDGLTLPSEPKWPEKMKVTYPMPPPKYRFPDWSVLPCPPCLKVDDPQGSETNSERDDVVIETIPSDNNPLIAKLPREVPIQRHLPLEYQNSYYLASPSYYRPYPVHFVLLTSAFTTRYAIRAAGARRHFPLERAALACHNMQQHVVRQQFSKQLGPEAAVWDHLPDPYDDPDASDDPVIVESKDGAGKFTGRIPAVEDAIRAGVEAAQDGKLSRPATAHLEPGGILDESAYSKFPAHHSVFAQQHSNGDVAEMLTPRLIPLLQWYDSTHLARTEYYRCVVFDRKDRRESDNMELVRLGDFPEDRLVQYHNGMYRFAEDQIRARHQQLQALAIQAARGELSCGSENAECLSSFSSDLSSPVRPGDSFSSTTQAVSDTADSDSMSCVPTPLPSRPVSPSPAASSPLPTSLPSPPHAATTLTSDEGQSHTEGEDRFDYSTEYRKALVKDTLSLGHRTAIQHSLDSPEKVMCFNLCEFGMWLLEDYDGALYEQSTSIPGLDWQTSVMSEESFQGKPVFESPKGISYRPFWCSETHWPQDAESEKDPLANKSAGPIAQTHSDNSDAMMKAYVETPTVAACVAHLNGHTYVGRSNKRELFKGARLSAATREDMQLDEAHVRAWLQEVRSRITT